jgi:putative Mn2+ efflux pump MntP
MSVAELLLIALGLSMDAFAAAICKGLSVKKLTMGNALLIGVWFGGFQALMPLLGYLLGRQLTGFIETFSHLIAFVLLFAIGIHMLREAYVNKKRGDGTSGGDSCPLSIKAMFLMAVATSIDALAVGVTFAFLGAAILPSVLTIGLLTFALSAAGAWIGRAFGAKYEFAAEIFGGVILCLLGVKVLLEHLGVL